MQVLRHEYQNKSYFRLLTRKQPSGSLLFVHGLGESGLCFETLVSRFYDHPVLSKWNVIIPDLSGYGRSLPSDDPVTLDTYADRLLHLSKTLPGPVILIGHSMGGVIGQIAAEYKQSTLHGFVNIEGNLTLGDCVFSGQAAEYSMDEFKNDGFEVLQNTVYENGIRFLPQRGYYASMRFADATQFYLNSIELTEFSKPENAAERFARLQLPTLYIGGSPRGICSKSILCLEQAKVSAKLLPECGHWPFLDSQKTVIDLLGTFISEHF